MPSFRREKYKGRRKMRIIGEKRGKQSEKGSKNGRIDDKETKRRKETQVEKEKKRGKKDREQKEVVDTVEENNHRIRYTRDTEE